MATEQEKKAFMAMVRRWIYMAIAILASALMPLKPVFSFHDDKGIIYIRSYTMDQYEFNMIETSLETGVATISETTSVRWLYYVNRIMLISCILCFLCFYSHRWRIWICNVTAIICGVYYALMLYYLVHIGETFNATLSPNFMALLPAVVLQMMILTRHNIIQSDIDEAEGE